MMQSGPAYHHGKTQWFVNGDVQGRVDGQSFVYSSDPSDSKRAAVAPRKTDPLNQDLAPQYNRTYHLQNAHERGYETTVMPSYERHQADLHHGKKQHFQKGSVAGGSTSNHLLYSTDELSREHQRRNRKYLEKATEFQYCSDKTTTGVGKQIPANKPNDALKLENRTEDDFARNKKLAFDQDEFLRLHREEKIKQRLQELEEQKKDAEERKMFWAKTFENRAGGGGAPRKTSQGEEPATRRTKNVNELLLEKYEPIGLAGGGGDVNRSTSGRPQPQFKTNPELRFPTRGPTTNIDPKLRYPPNSTYKEKLDASLEDTRRHREIERQRSFEKELEHLRDNPFGREGQRGGGAPLRDSKGEVCATFPLTLSKDANELRHVEPRHPHAYNDRSLVPPDRTDEENFYDPWQKGFGQPQLDSRGRLKPKRRPVVEDEPDGFFGKPSPRGPARKPQTLRKADGQTFSRDFSAKGRDYYDPFGREGAGAPMRNPDGSLKTNIMGRVEKDSITMNDPMARTGKEGKEKLLGTLREMSERAEEQKRAEREELKRGGRDVASWMRDEKMMVGQMRRNPITEEVEASRKHTSDVTAMKLNIHLYPDKQTQIQYHCDLAKQAEERRAKRQRERETDKNEQVAHVHAMQQMFGSPRGGAGAPLSKDEVTNARRQKVNLIPANQLDGFR